MASCYCNPMAVFSTVVFILGILMFSAGIAMVIAFSIHIVKPYDYSKNFVPTMCLVTYANIAGEMECSCSPSCACDCTSTYPCLSMAVQYRLSNGTLKHRARLYENYITLEKQTSKANCSVYECHFNENNNRDAVIRYRDTYGRLGKRFVCHYNPSNLNEVFRVKTERNRVMMTMLIALGSLFFGIIMAVFTWKKC